MRRFPERLKRTRTPILRYFARGVEWTANMKDVLIIIDAVKRAQAELSAYLQPGDRNAELTIAKLTGILQHRDVIRAMDAIYPKLESPSVAPSDSAEVEAVLHEALPGS
jgi:hypothetical protein